MDQITRTWILVGRLRDHSRCWPYGCHHGRLDVLYAIWTWKGYVELDGVRHYPLPTMVLDRGAFIHCRDQIDEDIAPAPVPTDLERGHTM